MKSHLLIAFTASLFLLACGDDGDDTTPDASMAMCVGSYAALTPAQFSAAATTGMCANTADLDLACSVDLSTLVGTCGTNCYLQVGNDEPMLIACTANCVNEDPLTVTNPSQGCLGCYIGSVACTLQNCIAECGGGASQPGCIACRAENNCTSDFFTCSGLPAPQAP